MQAGIRDKCARKRIARVSVRPMSLPPLPPEQHEKPQRYELRMSLLFASIFVPFGIHLPYFPLWLEAEGLSAAEIAIVLSVPLFLRVVTAPTITALADRAHERAAILIGLAAASLVLSLGYFLPASYWWLLGVSLALVVVWSPISPLADSLASSGVRRYGADYASMRLWGSLSFLVTNLVGGVIIGTTGAGIVPWLLSLGLVGTVVVSLAAPRLGRPRVASSGLSGAGRVVASRRFLGLVLSAGLAVGSHAFMYAFGSIYWTSIGIGGGVIGVLWAISVVAEIVLMALFRRYLGRFDAALLFILASGAAVLRWALMPLVEPAGLGVGGFAALQLLHAFTTGLTMVSVQKLIVADIPEERTGAAQGVAFLASGGAMAGFTLLSGPLYGSLGVQGFYVMAAVAGAGAVIALLLAYPHRAGSGGDTREPA